MTTVAKTLTAPDLAWADYSFGLYINGTDLNDILFGSAGADEIHGRAGNDYLSAGGGDDFLFGEQGNDTLSGGDGSDRLDGGSGDDMLYGGAGADMLIGGDGFDTVSYATSSQSVYVNLATNTGVFGEAQGDTFSGIDKVVGSVNSDGLFADDSGVVLDGGAGHDLLVGGAGLDVLIGRTGDDTLEGGLGLDILTGGIGADYFVFNWNDGPDIVTDFQPGLTRSCSETGSTIPIPGRSAPTACYGPERSRRRSIPMPATTCCSTIPTTTSSSRYRPRGTVRMTRSSHCWRRSATVCSYRPATSFLGEQPLWVAIRKIPNCICCPSQLGGSISHWQGSSQRAATVGFRIGKLSVRVRLGKGPGEHNESAYPPTAALNQTSRQVRVGPRLCENALGYGDP